MNITPLKITDSNVSVIGCGASEFSGHFKIIPSWKRGITNHVFNQASLGDAVIAFPNGYEIDGDLILMAGWGDGLSIRKLNDNGTLTIIYENLDPISPLNTNSSFNNIAIDKINKKLMICAYGAYGYAIYDYSPCLTGGAAISLETGTNVFTNGVSIDRVGTSYESGMVMAGEWLYLGDYDATHYQKFPRRNLETSAEELLDGTLIVDRSGYRYKLHYDEVNDRVYYFSFYNGNFVVILDASTATPIIKWVDVADAGLGDDAYEAGLFVIDPILAPNVVIVPVGQGGYHQLDISNCINDISTTPTLIGSIRDTNTNIGAQYWAVQFRLGCKYQNVSSNGQPHDKMLSQPNDFIPTTSDRNKNNLDGWYDIENNILVSMYNDFDKIEDITTGGRGASHQSDYSSPLVAMYSANSTKYWIKFSYGGNGGRVWVWDDTIGPGLIGNWEATFGDYTDTSNINIVTVVCDDFFVPSGCTLACYVSNDNLTWETYDIVNRPRHIFSTVGTTLRVKFVATGFEHKAPYYSSETGIFAIYGNTYQSEKTPTADLREKITKLQTRSRGL